jgi:hypothetical protein
MRIASGLPVTILLSLGWIPYRAPFIATPGDVALDALTGSEVLELLHARSVRIRHR